MLMLSPPALSRHGAGSRRLGCRSRPASLVVRAASAQQVQEFKAQLVRSVGSTQRGRNTTPQERQTILQLIESLEQQNPTPRPIDSPLLSGRWSLLYQAPTKEEDAVAQNPDTTLEGPVLARLRPVFGGFIRTKGITQIIDRQGGAVENMAEFVLLGSIPGVLNITGTCAPAEEDADAVQVDVVFTACLVKVGGVSVTLPLEWASPKGWVRTTYLDEDLRIGRGDKGSVFVTARQRGN